MPTKMSELPSVDQALPVWMLTKNGHPALIDGKQNSTGQDIVLLFSTGVKAATYAAAYPSLRDAAIVLTTIHALLAFFAGRVEYYILDRPAQRA